MLEWETGESQRMYGLHSHARQCEQPTESDCEYDIPHLEPIHSPRERPSR